MDFTSVMWGIPCIGIIFSMSFIPLISARFWNEYNKHVLIFWTAAYAVCAAWVFGVSKTFLSITEAIFSDYISFIIQISALFIVSGGIFINLARKSTPLFNTVFLFGSSILAGWIGTTGTATLMIRPILRANSHRRYRIHLVVFFIFLAANIGGAFTPLGDPPLFVGFTNGIDFFWFMKHLYPYIFGTLFFLCGLFFVIDSQLLKKEQKEKYSAKNNGDEPPEFMVKGKFNIVLLGLILLTVMFCNFDAEFTFLHEKYRWSSLLRNIILVSISLISMKFTPKSIRDRNHFSMAPIQEVAELFAGIFITAAPIIEILHQGTQGNLRWIFEQITHNGEFVLQKCFWISGLLSSILDNTPTFLIFFHLTSGNAQDLMTAHASLLTSFAISTVFMGALTYIGNAPNLMVRSIARNYGVKVPSFLEYMVWSFGILIPVFIVISYCL